MADDEWSTNANEAINISFLQVAKDKPIEVASYNPEYTEQQFDKEQSIFGYKNIKIDLRFAAHGLFPNFSYSYDEKWKTVKDAEAADIDGIFGQDLSPDALRDPAEFDQYLIDVDSAKAFKPPGRLVNSYTQDGRDYEVYLGELTDHAIRQIIERVQILITFFVDGGIPIPTNDVEWSQARWRVWLVYEKIKDVESPYSFVGYSTSYRFMPLRVPEHGQNGNTPVVVDFTDSDSNTMSLTQLPNRSRISQFLILPHHQGQSHGRKLYETVVNTFLEDPACFEITVEDPNEQFDDLRDLGDYERLSANGSFTQIQMNIDMDPKLTARRPGVKVPTGKILDKSLLEQIRKKNKLAKRQFKRLIELYLLSQIPRYTREAGIARLIRKANSSDKGDKAYWYWRLLVKQRIYTQHKQILDELEQDERITKLEETLEVQIADYERLLEKIAAQPANPPADRSPGIARRGKRMIIDDDEDESDASQASKRVKV